MKPDSRDIRNTCRRYKRGWPVRALAAAIVASLAFVGYALAGSATVSLGPTGPAPQTVTAEWGDTVAFTNTDTAAHGITSARPELNAPTIAPAGSFTTVLAGRAATYRYRQTGGRSAPGAIVLHVSGSVSLATSRSQVVFGQAIRLSGVASYPGTPVVLQQRLPGGKGWKTLATPTSGPDGSYEMSYTPPIGAEYRATIAGGQVASTVSAVDVRPQLTIWSPARKTMAGHRITIRSRITPGDAAAQLTLRQCNASRGVWTRVASVKPGAGGGASFGWTAQAGRNYLETTVVRRDGTVGYVPPTSRKIAITGIAPKAPPKHHGRQKAPSAPSRSC
jgi:plastocyanin